MRKKIVLFISFALLFAACQPEVVTVNENGETVSAVRGGSPPVVEDISTIADAPTYPAIDCDGIARTDYVVRSRVPTCERVDSIGDTLFVLIFGLCAGAAITWGGYKEGWWL